jgi:type II secretory pathway pseudopilin PulG
MKTKNYCRIHGRAAGYALLIVMTVVGIAILIAAATLSRTYTISKLNDRNNAYGLTVNAAEAAAEKAYAQMANDFMGPGLATVLNRIDNGYYSENSVPKASEDSHWEKFNFTDGEGNPNKVHIGYAGYINNYVGSGYTNTSTTNDWYPPDSVLGFPNAHGPVYRIVANANLKSGVTLTNAVQEEVWLAMVPLSQFSIFYNGVLEFTNCATFDVYGRVHCNTNVYVGGSSPLKFYNTLTTSGILGGSKNNVSFLGSPGYRTNQPLLQSSINASNAIAIIQIPPASELPNTAEGRERMYNKAHVVLLVTNNLVTLKVQKSINQEVPGADPSPTVVTFTNVTTITSNLPFLTLTNKFYDQREEKTNVTTQIDVGKYATWLSTNSQIAAKFPSGSGAYPTILYVSDRRTTNANQLTVIRITNGIAPPVNGGLGFTLATANPLYVWGNYNQTNASLLGTTNTSSGTVPCALMSDALTVLSSAWKDADSTKTTTYHGSNNRRAVNTTINAAIVTGVVPSTPSAESGGVHNLPRLLEDWLYPSQDKLALNTSILCLFRSAQATSPFRHPANYQEPCDPYYDPPKRQFNFDRNFELAHRQPPGMPCALVAYRLTWKIPPPNTVTYNGP